MKYSRPAGRRPGEGALAGPTRNVGSLKNRLELDDSLDVFGVHGLGGVVGSVGTGIVSAPALGGFGADNFSIAGQTLIQIQAVLIAMAWSAVGSAIAFLIVEAVLGMRVASDAEREGLDITDHGERAYNF